VASRELRVSFVSDTKALERGFKAAETRTQKFTRAAGVAGLALGGVLAVGMKKSVDAAVEAQKSQARLEAQLKASGISFQSHAQQIESVIQKHSQLSGLDDEDLTDAFTNIVRITGDVDRSLRLTGLAADFARAKHMDVAKAGEIVAKVAGGNTGILSRYGIQIEKGASATQALGQLQQKFAGQAEAYGRTAGGAQDRFRVAVENLQEAMGRGLLPMLTRVANGIATVSRWAERNQTTFKALVAGAALLAGTLATLSVAGKVAAAMSTLRTATLAVNAAMRANPVGAVITVVVALGVALVAAYQKSEKFRAVVDGAFRAVRNAVVTAVDKILGLLSSWLRGMEKVYSFASKIPLVGKAFEPVKNAAGRAADEVDNLRESIRGLKSKSVTIDVTIVGKYKGGRGKLTPVPGLEQLFRARGLAGTSAALIRPPDPTPGPSVGQQTAVAQWESLRAMIESGVTAGTLPDETFVNTQLQKALSDRISAINKRQNKITDVLKTGRGWKGWRKQNAKQRRATLRQFREEFLALEQEEAGLWNQIGGLQPDSSATGGAGEESEEERRHQEQLAQDERQHQELLALQEQQAEEQRQRDEIARQAQEEANRLQAEQNERLAAIQAEQAAMRNFRESVTAETAHAVMRWLVSAVGQSQGQNLAGRRLTPSIGTARSA